MPEKDRFSDSATDWTLVPLTFTVENYGTKLYYDQIDTPHAIMCFSKITISHSVYWLDHVIFLIDLFKSKPDFRKWVLLVFLFENDNDLLIECGF